MKKGSCTCVTISLSCVFSRAHKGAALTFKPRITALFPSTLLGPQNIFKYHLPFTNNRYLITHTHFIKNKYHIFPI